MALPKRKHSKSRRDKSRTHWKLGIPSLTKCPQCATPVIAHRVCTRCGYYRTRQLVVIRSKKKSEEA